jgi:hypothetical protein
MIFCRLLRFRGADLVRVLKVIGFGLINFDLGLDTFIPLCLIDFLGLIFDSLNTGVFEALGRGLPNKIEVYKFSICSYTVNEPSESNSPYIV